MDNWRFMSAISINFNFIPALRCTLRDTHYWTNPTNIDSQAELVANISKAFVAYAIVESSIRKTGSYNERNYTASDK
jgi:hypothetical protein